MEVLEYVKDDPIAEFATLKIRSGVDNKFFDYNIKNFDDQLMLNDLLDRTSKSFFNLEKSFVSFLETGKAKFKISKNRVDWVDSNDQKPLSTHILENSTLTAFKKDPIEYEITCNVSFIVGDSYLGFYKMANNEINAINNYIKAAKLYASGIQHMMPKKIINDSIKNLEHNIYELESELSNTNEILDKVYEDFKSQLVNVFLEAVSVRSNGLINTTTLKDRITANLTNVTTEEVKDGFYDKLEQARANFINMNKDIIEDLLGKEIKIEMPNRTEESNTENPNEFFKESSNSLHQNLRNTIIVNEHNSSFEETVSEIDSVKPVDPNEFFDMSNSPLNKVAEKIDEIDLEGPENSEESTN